MPLSVSCEHCGDLFLIGESIACIDRLRRVANIWAQPWSGTGSFCKPLEHVHTGCLKAFCSDRRLTLRVVEHVAAMVG